MTKNQMEKKLEHAKSTFQHFDMKYQLLISVVVGIVTSLVLRLAKSYFFHSLVGLFLVVINSYMNKEKLSERFQKIKETAKHSDFLNMIMQQGKSFAEENVYVTIGFVTGVLLGLKFL